MKAEHEDQIRKIIRERAERLRRIENETPEEKAVRLFNRRFTKIPDSMKFAWGQCEHSNGRNIPDWLICRECALAWFIKENEVH